MNLICEMKDANITSENGFIMIKNDNEEKYFNKDGKEVENFEVYPDNTLFAKNENNKWGFINKNGDLIVEAEYDEVTEFNKYGFAAVKKDGKWGSIDKEGKEITGEIYELDDNQKPFFIGKYYQIKYGFGEVYFTNN